MEGLNFLLGTVLQTTFERNGADFSEGPWFIYLVVCPDPSAYMPSRTSMDGSCMRQQKAWWESNLIFCNDPNKFFQGKWCVPEVTYARSPQTAFFCASWEVEEPLRGYGLSLGDIFHPWWFLHGGTCLSSWKK